VAYNKQFRYKQMLHNATLADLFGSTEAMLLLALFVFVPGYVAGWLTNVLRFREQKLSMRLLLSTPLAIAIVPITADLAGRYPPLLWALFAAVWAMFAVLLFQEIRSGGGFKMSREIRIGAIIVAAWAILALASLVDLQWGNQVYFSSSAYDHSVRTAMVAAASRSIPPTNPFFGGISAPTLRYHYFWMTVCGLVTRLAGVAPRHALYGSTVWAGIALMSLIVIALRFFAGVRERLARKALIGFGLLAVTGLDLLPLLYESHFKVPKYADPEWWNVQITSWVDVMLWTPHHLLAMVACILGFIILRQTAPSRRERVVNVVIAAFAFASAAGLSVLVTSTFAVFAAIWLLISVYRGWWDEIVPFAAAGAASIMLALPYLHILLGHGAGTTVSGSGAGDDSVRFVVREFPLGMRMLARHTNLHLPPNLVNFVLLPISYFFELGFFLFVAVVRFKRAASNKVRLSREEIATWTMVATSFLIGSFVRSSWQGNDLGWRCFLQAQFIFLLWAALLLDDWWSKPSLIISPRARRIAYTFLVIGVLGTAYQVINLRIYPILHDRGLVRGPEWLDADRQTGKRTAALRSAYGSIQSQVPNNAIVQFNPLVKAYIPHLLYSNHDAAAATSGCGTGFGGDAARCEARMTALTALYTDPSPTESDGLDDVCEKYGISVILAEDTDPVWNDRQSWVWKRTPLIANHYVRAFRCER
jgi:hypothetical protein